MLQVHVDPRLTAEGLKVAAIMATPAIPDEQGRLAYRQLFDATIDEVRQRATRNEQPATIPALRRLHERFGGRSKRVELPQLKLAQSLLQGRFKSIHPIVDVYNLWSARLGLSIGAFDADRIQGSVSVRVTVGNERFCPIGVTQSKTVEAGAFAYVDEANEVLCWLDIRQGERTKLTSATRNALVLIEGIDPLSVQELQTLGAEVAASLLETEVATKAVLLEIV